MKGFHAKPLPVNAYRSPEGDWIVFWCNGDVDVLCDSDFHDRFVAASDEAKAYMEGGATESPPELILNVVAQLGPSERGSVNRHQIDWFGEEEG